jgi:hypothetical protein
MEHGAWGMGHGARKTETGNRKKEKKEGEMG